MNCIKAVTFILVVICHTFAYGHSGGTDSSGGHRQNGVYHHHGGSFYTPTPRTRYVPVPTTRRKYRTYGYDVTTGPIVGEKPKVKYRTTARKSKPVARTKARWASRKITFEYLNIEDDGQCKIMLYVDYVVDRATLVAVAKLEKEVSVWYYLPGMNGGKGPWAVAELSGSRFVCNYKKENLRTEDIFRIKGNVYDVADGETLTIDFDDHMFKVRLLGVQAPKAEIAFAEKTFADKAKDHLTGLAMTKEAVVSWKDQNVDNELIGTVKIDGVNINAAMIKDGYAKVTADLEKFDSIEVGARVAGKGLWAEGWTGE